MNPTNEYSGVFDRRSICVILMRTHITEEITVCNNRRNMGGSPYRPVTPIRWRHQRKVQVITLYYKKGVSLVTLLLQSQCRTHPHSAHHACCLTKGIACQPVALDSVQVLVLCHRARTLTQRLYGLFIRLVVMGPSLVSLLELRH